MFSQFKDILCAGSFKSNEKILTIFDSLGGDI